MALEYIIYTDESDKKGKYYSNFYGGVLVRSDDLQLVIGKLEKCKIKLNLYQEVKWQKVTANYLDKYVKLMDCFFNEVEEGRAKVRIMFTQNQYVPIGLSSEQRRTGYHLLYYQFIKHAFGLSYAGTGRIIYVRINMDQLPDNREQNAQFKSFLLGLNQNSAFKAKGLRFSADRIAEVRSHEHVLPQCLDIVLGAISFRLNDKHKEKLSGKYRRGKRTIAKETLYKYINKRIRQIYPRFNIGESTGRDSKSDLWRHPYRHWKLIPKQHKMDSTKTKPNK